jgi:hypothetical protein
MELSFASITTDMSFTLNIHLNFGPPASLSVSQTEPTVSPMLNNSAVTIPIPVLNPSTFDNLNAIKSDNDIKPPCPPPSITNLAAKPISLTDDSIKPLSTNPQSMAPATSSQKFESIAKEVPGLLQKVLQPSQTLLPVSSAARKLSFVDDELDILSDPELDGIYIEAFPEISVSKDPIIAALAAVSPSFSPEKRTLGSFMSESERQILSNPAMWLNDTIIDYWITRMNDEANTPALYGLSSFFYQKIKARGGEKTSGAFLGALDTKMIQFLCIPVNIHSSHWILALIQFGEDVAQIILYDSMAHPHRPTPTKRLVIQKISKWIENLKIGPKRLLVQSEYSQAPQQPGTSECGQYMLAMIECIFKYRTSVIMPYASEVHKRASSLRRDILNSLPANSKRIRKN